MQTRGSTRIVARIVRALLLEDEALFAGGKLLVNSDVLVVLYLQDGVQLDEDKLHDIADCCEAERFTPYNSDTADPHLVWLGYSSKTNSVCKPVY